MQNRLVFITGSSSGIGAETALAFAALGARLVLTYHRDRKAAEMVVQRCKDAGSPQVIAFELDLSDDKSIEQVSKKVIGLFGGIDVLVNNAGIGVWKKLQDQTFDEIHQQIAVNLEGMIKMSRACMGSVRRCIINVGSGAGFSAYAELSTYCATKFAVRGFTQALAKELPNIKVFCVNPGMTATRMTDFKGRPPAEVAGIIVKAARGHYPFPTGADLNAWELLEKLPA